MSMRTNILSLIGGAAFCTFLIGAFMTVSDGSQPPAAGDVAKQRFGRLQHRTTPADLGGVKGLWPSSPATRPSKQEIDELRGQAIDPLQAFSAGDTEWEETAFMLNDLFWLREQRLQCAQDHALELGVSCRAEYVLLVNPSEIPGEGTIVDGDVQTGEFNERMTETDRAACAAYAGCLLEARVGSSIPLPRDQAEPVAIRQPIVYEWAAAALFEPARVRELIGMYEDSMASAPAIMDDRERWFFRNEQHQLDYLRYHLSVLESEGREDE
jgi:hypothetical protein